MASIKNVAITGASGSLGSVVLQRLIVSGLFHIRILRRFGSKSHFPPQANIEVIDVDFNLFDSVKGALIGQDALISTVGTEGFDAQKILVDAAISAGVKRFLPSEFGSNLDNAKARKQPVFASKVKIQNYLKELAAKGELKGTSYTLVYNSAFLDWGLQHDFILGIHGDPAKPIIIDGGDVAFSTTSLASVGDAVVGILTHPEETKNRVVRIHDLIITQNKLLALAKKLAPGKKWEPIPVKLDDMTANADARLAKGLFDMETFGPYIYRAIFDPACEGTFEKNDNALLGLKGKTEADVEEILKSLLK